MLEVTISFYTSKEVLFFFLNILVRRLGMCLAYAYVFFSLYASVLCLIEKYTIAHLAKFLWEHFEILKFEIFYLSNPSVIER